MILVVTPNLAAEDCAKALRQATSEEIVMAASLGEAATRLRTESYLAVVLDQYLLETEPDETETVMRHLGTAIPLQVNLAISGGARPRTRSTSGGAAPPARASVGPTRGREHIAK